MATVATKAGEWRLFAGSTAQLLSYLATYAIKREDIISVWRDNAADTIQAIIKNRDAGTDVA